MVRELALPAEDLKMYKLNKQEAKQLSAKIKKSGNRDDGYKCIDDYAKEKCVYSADIESSFVLDFPDSQVFNAMQWVS